MVLVHCVTSSHVLLFELAVLRDLQPQAVSGSQPAACSQNDHREYFVLKVVNTQVKKKRAFLCGSKVHIPRSALPLRRMSFRVHASIATCPRASQKLHNVTEEFGRNMETRQEGGKNEYSETSLIWTPLGPK